MEFRKAYDHLSPDTRYSSRVSFIDPETGEPLETLTQQHMKAETDINNILRRYDKTGLITHINQAVAQYGDFTEANEYQEALNRIISAQDTFAALPSEIRKRFGNDPGAFFEFATNPDNAKEMVALGLAEHEPVPKKQDPIEVKVVTENEG
jgi:phage internal scaffolding protein